MGFKSLFIGSATTPQFGYQKLLLNYKERPHISKSVLDKKGCIYVDVDNLEQFKYDPINSKYIAFTNLTYDFAIVVYNFDKKEGIAYRTNNNSNKELFLKYLNIIKKFKSDNVEARIFGSQNKYLDKSEKNVILDILSKNFELNEIDIFGNEIRNIAIDTETGQSFDILMENKLYKPGELTTKITREDFEAKIMKNNDNVKGAAQNKK